jgi:hypothetical protein
MELECSLPHSKKKLATGLEPGESISHIYKVFLMVYFATNRKVAGSIPGEAIGFLS